MLTQGYCPLLDLKSSSSSNNSTNVCVSVPSFIDDTQPNSHAFFETKVVSSVVVVVVVCISSHHLS